MAYSQDHPGASNVNIRSSRGSVNDFRGGLRCCSVRAPSYQNCARSGRSRRRTRRGSRRPCSRASAEARCALVGLVPVAVRVADDLHQAVLPMYIGIVLVELPLRGRRLVAGLWTLGHVAGHVVSRRDPTAAGDVRNFVDLVVLAVFAASCQG